MTEKEKFFADYEKKRGLRFCEESSYNGYGSGIKMYNLEEHIRKGLQQRGLLLASQKKSDSILEDLKIRKLYGEEGQYIHLIPAELVGNYGFDFADLEPLLGGWNGFQRETHLYFPLKDFHNEEVYDAKSLELMSKRFLLP